MITLSSREALHKYVIEVASRSQAKKRKVGAVIANLLDDGSYKIQAEGYNHTFDGSPCEDEHGQTTDKVVHAEVACLLNHDLDYIEIARSGARMYITYPPCDRCKQALGDAGILYEVVGDFMKFDSKKPRMALVPTSLKTEVAKVLTYGAKKYKVNNWRNTPDIECYISALERHLIAWQNGEEFDPESGLHHLSHAATNIAFLIELKDLPKIKSV